MRLTGLITFRSIATRRLRSFLTLFGIVLGVAGIFSINFTNQNAYRSITRIFEGTAGRVSLEVRSSANVGGFNQDLLDRVLESKGVADAVPVIKLPVALPGETPTEIDLNFFGTGAGGFLIHGIDLDSELKVRDYKLAQGRFFDPEAENREVVLVDVFADEQGIAVGDEISILTSFGLTDLQVVGVIAKEGAGLTNLGKFGVVDLPVAQLLAQRDGEIDQIDVVVSADQADPDALADVRNSLATELGDGYAVVFPASQGERMGQMLSGYQIGLNFMAGIALFVGAFLIYNAFSMTVVERTRELGLLRSVGMTRRQVTGQVLIEGLLLGLLGAVAGAGLGIVMASGLTGLMSNVIGQPLDTGNIPLPILAGSMAVGVILTLLASYLPARQAGRISPLEALRIRGRTHDGWLLQYGWVIGILLLIVSTGILIWNPFPYDVQFRLGSMTVFALFFGAMLIIPITLRAWQVMFSWLFHLLFGAVGDIGSRNLERARKRTMLTCTALMIGVSMVVVTQGMTGSFTADLYRWMDAYAGGDIFISAPIPLTRDLQQEIESLSGVDVVAPIRYVEVTWQRGQDEEKINLMAVDPESYLAVTRFVFSEPEAQPDQAITDLKKGGSVFVSSVIAEKYGLKPGDSMLIKTRGSDEVFQVAAVVLDFFNQGMVITGSWSDLVAYFDVNDAGTFLVKKAADVSVNEAIDQISASFKDDYQLVIESNSSIRERADQLMSQAFVMFDVLGILAVLVAALGVLNTMSMSVLERTREIGMLRSMGMSRRQVIAMILAEAGLLGLIGGALGLGFGLVLTRIFLTAMGAMSGYDLDFVMPTRALWLSIVIALATSQLAALLPARRAAKTPILAAIHYE